MSVLTVTPNFPDEIFRINAFFNGVGQGSVRYSSPTVIVLGTSDLARLAINGHGFQYDDGQENAWVTGTITSIALWDLNYDRKIAEIRGLNIALSDLGPRFGLDMYSAEGLISFLFGGNDSLVGSSNRDSFYAYDGNDTVSSGAGDDDITPGAGNDIVNGGSGYDLVSYWNYQVPNGDENSRGAVVDLRLAQNTDPWGGADQIISIEGVEGTYYADTLTGNGGANSFYGLGGNDRLIGLGGDDFFIGGQGADTLDGGDGYDMISYVNYAGTGTVNVNLSMGTVTDPWGRTDTILSIEAVRGTGNSDTLVGVKDDFFQGMGGNDTIDGGVGGGRASYAADKSCGGLLGVKVDLAAGTARDGFGSTDTLRNIYAVDGSQFGDVLDGNSSANVFRGRLGADTMDGRGGNDKLFGEEANDKLFGNSGNDNLSGGDGKDSLMGGTGHDWLTGDAGNDTLTDDSGNDSQAGGAGNDRMVSGSGSDWLSGDAGKDSLSGGSGDDWLYGGEGNDTLTGWSGSDGFVFDRKLSKTINVDSITDFSSRYDTIFLDDAVLRKIKLGYLATSSFRVGSKANDKDDRVIHDKKTGALYYDPDGSGGAAQIKFATLATNLKLTASDFVVY